MAALPETLALLRSPASGNPADKIKEGVVVEEVGENSEGKKAGLRPGDIILQWKRGSVGTRLEGPKDEPRLQQPVLHIWTRKPTITQLYR